MHKLTGGKFMKVNELAKNTRSGDFLRILYGRFKERDEVLLEIVKNPATPVDVLSDIAKSCEDFEQNFNHSHYKIIARISTCPDLLRNAYKYGKDDTEILKLLKANPYTPGDVRSSIVNDEVLGDFLIDSLSSVA